MKAKLDLLNATGLDESLSVMVSSVKVMPNSNYGIIPTRLSSGENIADDYLYYNDNKAYSYNPKLETLAYSEDAPIDEKIVGQVYGADGDGCGCNKCKESSSFEGETEGETASYQNIALVLGISALVAVFLGVKYFKK